MKNLIYKLLVLIPCFLIINFTLKIDNCPAQSGWFSLNSGSTAALLSTFFTDANTGYVVGNPGVVLKTTNAGSNWFSQSISSTEILRYVSFTDVNTGYIAGGSTTGGNVYKTTNGGNSWNALILPNYVHFYSIFFNNSNTGYVSGNEIILKTTDAGMTWTNKMFTGYSYISQVYFADESTGYACSYSKKIMKTTNAGANWQDVFTYTGVGYLNGLQFINANTGTVVGGNTTDLGSASILRTTDGGINWTNYSFNNSTIYGLGRVQFVNSNIGYICGGGLTVNTLSTIMKTTDGGSNWYFQISNTNNAFRGIYFSNINTGYVVGSGGTIFKTTDGGGTMVGINTEYNQIPEQFSLSQNYPNPFNPSTKINFAIPKSGLVTLKVYDILGREVKTLVNEIKSPGNYAIGFNGSELTSGVYFCRMQSAGFSDVKKLVLLK